MFHYWNLSYPGKPANSSFAEFSILVALAMVSTYEEAVLLPH
jgi:hypothetical protein